MQRWRNVRGSQKAQASGREWMLGILKGNSGNGFLKQTCGTYLFSAVRHILRTSAAERLAATRQSRQLFTGLQQFHRTTESTITAS